MTFHSYSTQMSNESSESVYQYSLRYCNYNTHIRHFLLLLHHRPFFLLLPSRQTMMLLFCSRSSCLQDFSYDDFVIFLLQRRYSSHELWRGVLYRIYMTLIRVLIVLNLSIQSRFGVLFLYRLMGYLILVLYFSLLQPLVILSLEVLEEL